MSWSLFDGWKPPDAALASWKSLDALQISAQAFLRQELSLLPETLSTWKKRLPDFDGDPSIEDWQNFRPLLLGREEDWSDWLAYLIGSSRTGQFSSELFGRPAKDCSSAKVTREETVEDRRADIVIQWAKGEFTHVEVKIGDPHLSKTFSTAEKLRRRYAGASTWRDLILIPESMTQDWTECQQRHQGDFPGLEISRITWEQVTQALRLSLLTAKEPHPWRSFAFGFCGCIEQLLLRLPILSSTEKTSHSELFGIQRRMAMMRRILDHGGSRG